MNWENKVNELCVFINHQISWFIILVISLVPLSIILGLLFLGYELLSSIFLMSSMLILSTILILTTLSSPKSSLLKIPLPNIIEDDHETKTIQEPPKQAQEEEEEEEESISESDCVDSSDYDGSISDEESLIEIALPSGHYVGHYDQDYNNNKKITPILDTNLFPQRILMELLAEINELNSIEEENLIEIDISMGSIMCSRFEIKA